VRKGSATPTRGDTRVELLLIAPKTQRLRPSDWPVSGSVASEHAGLFLLLPELLELTSPGLVAAGRLPGHASAHGAQLAAGDLGVETV